MTRRLSALIFDAGGVLLHPAEETFVAAAAACGHRVERADVPTLVHRLVHLGAQSEDPRRFWTSATRFTALARLLRTDARRAEEIWTTATSSAARPLGLWTRLDPDAREALTRVRAGGLRTAVVSNGDGTLQRRLDRVAVGTLFDVVVESAVVGLEKPDPRIFHLAADRLGVGIADCVFVGDDPFFDIEASIAAGVQRSVLVDVDGCWSGSGESVRSLRQVPSMVLEPAERRAP